MKNIENNENDYYTSEGCHIIICDDCVIKDEESKNKVLDSLAKKYLEGITYSGST